METRVVISTELLITALNQLVYKHLFVCINFPPDEVKWKNDSAKNWFQDFYFSVDGHSRLGLYWLVDWLIPLLSDWLIVVCWIDWIGFYGGILGLPQLWLEATEGGKPHCADRNVVQSNKDHGGVSYNTIVAFPFPTRLERDRYWLFWSLFSSAQRAQATISCKTLRPSTSFPQTGASREKVAVGFPWGPKWTYSL